MDISFHLDGDFLQGDGARAGFLALLGMLGSFGFIRMSTRLMRSPKVPWWPGSVETAGGLHIHHLVFGIVLILLAGFLSFALQPDGALLTVLAIAFGIGAGLTLDEFALWLYLDDVYWSEEGRRSVDAVIIATIVAGGFALGFVPLGSESESGASLATAIAFNLGLCTLAALKGKVASALIGMFVPFVSIVAAIRLARPGSPWARRRYAPQSKKLAKAEAREARHARRVVRWQNRIGGAPTPETDG
jgi:lysyl-tRNA synthetase, class II